MSYSVQVTIWSNGTTYSETVAQGDDTPGNVAASYGLADPLTITRALSSGDRLIQQHPEPQEASFQLIAANATTYAALALGDPVAIKVYPAASFAGTPATFYGRVSSVLANPHDLGVIYTVGCLDYLADLAEIPVGAVNYPSERLGPRLYRIMAEGGVRFQDGTDLRLANSGFVQIGGTSGSGDMLPARSASSADLLSLVLELLDSEVTLDTVGEDGFTYGNPTANGLSWLQQRSWIQPRITNDRLDPVTPYLIGSGIPLALKRIHYTPPGRLALVGGKYVLTMDAANTSPATGAPIIDGGQVTMAPTFSQLKGAGLPSRVVVTDAGGDVGIFDWQQSTDNFQPGSPTQNGFPLTGQQVVTQQIQIVSADNQGRYQPWDWRVPFSPDLKAGWATDELVWNVWNVAGWQLPGLGDLLTISRAQLAKMPPNREWLAGQVDSVKLTVAKGRPTVSFTLQPVQLDHLLNAFVMGAAAGVARFDSPGFTQVSRTNLQEIPQPGATGNYNGSTNGWGTSPTATNNATGGPIATSPQYRRFTAVAAFTPPAQGVIMLQQRALPGVTGTGSKKVVAGETCTLSIYVRSSIAQTVKALGVFLDSTGAVATGVSTAVGPDVTLVANTWTRISITAANPVSGSNAAIVRLDVRAGQSTRLAWAIGDTFDMSACMIEAGSSATAYFDGASGLGYAWTGVANASTSTESFQLTLGDLGTRDTFTDYQLLRGS